MCMPMRRGDEVTRDVLQRPGRFQQVAENLRVKEVVVGEGERRRRYVVCHNPQEEKRQRVHRRQVLRELEAALASVKEVRGESHSKRVCQLRASRRYGPRLGRLAEIGLTSGGLYAGSNSSKMSSHLRPRANSEATKRKSPDHASRTIV
jgi:hypothetical protein